MLGCGSGHATLEVSRKAARIGGSSNAKIGGSSNSRHRLGIAFNDFSSKGNTVVKCSSRRTNSRSGYIR